MTAAERKQVHWIRYIVGNIPICGIRSVQSLSQNVSILRPFAVTVCIGCLSVQTSVNLYRTAPRELQVNTPYNYNRYDQVCR